MGGAGLAQAKLPVRMRATYPPPAGHRAVPAFHDLHGDHLNAKRRNQFEGTSLRSQLTAPKVKSRDRSAASSAAELAFFLIAILGFSFWFFLAVPFASHRETYWWLAMVKTQGVADALSVISSTYRPLAQLTTWLAFLALDPAVFPTSPVRQAIAQCLIYGCFVGGWWHLYRGAPERRVLAAFSLVTGAVFFSGYVHLFHIYGLFYAPVILTLGALVRWQDHPRWEQGETTAGLAAIILTLWHPFATGLFGGFYFGYYLDTFRNRNRAGHWRALAILAGCLLALLLAVVLFARPAGETVPPRWVGFLVSYRTNEVNPVAMAVALMLAGASIWSMKLTPAVRAAALAIAAGGAALCLRFDVPILLVWLATVLCRLGYERCWRLFFLMGAATLLPVGSGIGTPIYGLFAIALATYVTAWGWSATEQRLARIPAAAPLLTVCLAGVTLVALRGGTTVPWLTPLSTPLLAERERTYQMEEALDRLSRTKQCGAEIYFADEAGSPVSSVESALDRRHRPPAWIGDVRLFWKKSLGCGGSRPDEDAPSLILTFGDQTVPDAKRVFAVPGRYAGAVSAWIGMPSGSHAR